MALSEPNYHGDYVEYFQDLIILQEGAIASFKKWVVGFLLVGLASIGIAFVLYSRFQGLVPHIVGFGGVFIGASAAFPYREIIPRRFEIKTYSLIKRRFETFRSLSDEERKRTLDFAEDVIKKKI